MPRSDKAKLIDFVKFRGAVELWRRSKEMYKRKVQIMHMKRVLK